MFIQLVLDLEGFVKDAEKERISEGRLNTFCSSLCFRDTKQNSVYLKCMSQNYTLTMLVKYV